MNKFEKLIEYIINDEDQKARELFHSIVVDKSRDIYESIMDEEMGVQGDQVGNLNRELQDEEAMGEGDEEFSLGGDSDEDGELDGGMGDAMGGDMGAGDEFGGADMGGDMGSEASQDEKIMNIDAKLDELLAKFDDIMGNEQDLGGEPAGEPAADFGGEQGEGDNQSGTGSDEFGQAQGEEEAIAEGENPFAKGSGSAMSGKSGKSGSAMSGKSGKSGSGKMESRKSTVDLMREYVDTIQQMNLTGASEGDAVGAAGKKTSINDKSITGPGADFGGTNKNIARGGSEQAADGKPTPQPNNEYTKGRGEIKSGNVNVPGGKAGAPKSTGHEYTKDAKGAEGKTTSGTVPVAKKSVQVQNTGRK
jgi:hypothetical protein